jgi:hypothetical protein
MAKRQKRSAAELERIRGRWANDVRIEPDATRASVFVALRQDETWVRRELGTGDVDDIIELLAEARKVAQVSLDGSR